MKRITLGSALLAVALSSFSARADIAVSSNDGHSVLRDGAQVAANPALPDTISVIDLKGKTPAITATIEVPGSVLGPPFAVWVAPDETWCIVTAATKPDAAGRAGLSPSDAVSVIDLTASPPKLTQSLTAGAGAASVRVSPDGTLALVANRAEGTISVFSVHDRRLTPAGKVDLGNPRTSPSGLAFTKDGHAALLSRDADSIVSVLRIDGTIVTVDPRPLTTGVHPYTLDVNAAGTLAAVANMGRGDGDVDTVSLIDLTSTPFHTVETFSVPRGPEGLKFSPDGRFLAVGSQMGTQKAAGNPFRTDHGLLTLFAVRGDTNHGIGPGQNRVRQVAQAPIGGWSQGFAFSRDGRTLLIQDMVEQKIQVFRWEKGHLTEAAPLPVKGGPAAIRTSWP